MSDEKPLHVRVAEKLGFAGLAPCDQATLGGLNDWHFSIHASPASETLNQIWEKHFDYGDWFSCRHRQNIVPQFDLDWSATGPLIERLGIHLDYSLALGWRAQHSVPDMWPMTTQTLGNTPLESVCNLILALPDDVVRGGGSK